MVPRFLFFLLCEFSMSRVSLHQAIILVVERIMRQRPFCVPLFSILYYAAVEGRGESSDWNEDDKLVEFSA